MKRKKKFVVWLHNKTDRRDDEWVVVRASSKRAVEKLDIGFDRSRFSRGPVYTAKEFRDMMGIAA